MTEAPRVSGGNSATEGNAVEFTITLSKASAETVAVNYTPHRDQDVAELGVDASFEFGFDGKIRVPPLPTPPGARCFRHQLLLPSPYLVLTKPLRLDIQCQRAASVKIGWKYLDD